LHIDKVNKNGTYKGSYITLQTQKLLIFEKADMEVSTRLWPLILRPGMYESFSFGFSRASVNDNIQFWFLHTLCFAITYFTELGPIKAIVKSTSILQIKIIVEHFFRALVSRSSKSRDFFDMYATY